MDERERVKSTLRRLRGEHSVNTARNFRLQQMQATLVTHESYWSRICRQIEEGTFKRDRLKAERMLAERQGRGKTGPVPSASPAAPEAEPSPAKPPAGVAYPAAIQRLHQAYVEAQRAGGAAKTLSIDALANTIIKQTAAIKERYKCKEVEFRVVVKDNKPVLKAVPK